MSLAGDGAGTPINAGAVSLSSLVAPDFDLSRYSPPEFVATLPSANLYLPKSCGSANTSHIHSSISGTHICGPHSSDSKDTAVRKSNFTFCQPAVPLNPLRRMTLKLSRFHLYRCSQHSFTSYCTIIGSSAAGFFDVVVESSFNSASIS